MDNLTLILGVFRRELQWLNYDRDHSLRLDRGATLVSLNRPTLSGNMLHHNVKLSV